MKLPLAIAVLDAVDSRGLKLTDTVTIYKQDLSVYVQPVARLVTPSGYSTTVGDLIRRAVIESDNAAADILMARLGGAEAVQRVLLNKGLTGVRIDRDERHLQSEILGLAWRAGFVDPEAFERAAAAIPEKRRTEAFNKYLTDPRDTATPRAMAALLTALDAGQALSPASTAYLLKAMSDTTTGPDRLKAGLAPGWTIAHKTGTSGSWNGVTAATNDVGILTSPTGQKFAIAVFVADSTAGAAQRAAVIARIASAVTGK